MKFNDTAIGIFFFNYFELESFGYKRDQEYKYEELEDQNCHNANFLFNLILRGRENIAKILFEIGLFHQHPEPDNKLLAFLKDLHEIEGFLAVTIEYALRTDPMQLTHQEYYGVDRKNEDNKKTA